MLVENTESQSLEQLLRDMRRKRIKQNKQCLKFRAVESARLVRFVQQTHHSCDSGVEFQRFNVLGDLLDGLMH